MRNAGFSLIELVVVIVVMSLVSVAGVQMIRFGVEGYQKMSSRQAMGSASRVAVERISRELRNALPNSPRVTATGECLEFVPITAAGSYIDLATETASDSFQTVALPASQQASNGRVVVYPLVTADIYNPAAGVVSGQAALGSPDGDNRVTVTLDAAMQFAAHSPRRRFYLVPEPVSYCVAGEYLFRYSGYGFQASQLGLATLPAAPPGRALLADGVGVTTTPFRVQSASLSRNAMVALDLMFTTAGESTRLVSEVQLRNVP